MPTINAFWPWFIIAVALLLGIVLTLRHLSKTMDFSRAFFKRWDGQRDDRGDDGGIWTPLDEQDRRDVKSEKRKLRSGVIPETGLRADLPPGTSDEVEQEIVPVKTVAGKEPPPADEPDVFIGEKNVH